MGGVESDRSFGIVIVVVVTIGIWVGFESFGGGLCVEGDVGVVAEALVTGSEDEARFGSGEFGRGDEGWFGGAVGGG